MTSYVNSQDGAVVYTPDDTGQLTDAVYEGEQQSDEHYGYDANENRGITTTHFVYDGHQIVMQFDDQALTHRYLWGEAVDQLLADEAVTDPQSAGSVVWPLTDHLNTVRYLAIYDAQNDATTIANHRVFSAYGELVSETDPDVDCLFAFTGRALDCTTNVQNNLHRWYDPTVGRWLSEDPIGFAGRDANLYRYVGNGPTNAVDPTGCLLRLEVKKLVKYYSTGLAWSGLSDDERTGALAAEALHLAKGDATLALSYVMDARGSIGGGDDNWASTDHYLNALGARQMCGILGSLSATVCFFGYHFLKFYHFPVGQDHPNIPPSPATWQQLKWAIAGAW